MRVFAAYNPKEKPKHLDPRATEFISIRILPEWKMMIKHLAEKEKCSMTKVILASLLEHFENQHWNFHSKQAEVE